MSLGVPAMPRKNCDFLRQFIGVTLLCGLSGLLLWLLPFSQVRASQSTSGLASAGASVHRDANLSPTIAVEEAEDLINLLPATKELRAKGMDVKWDAQAVPTMNNRDYYFFWVYNVTAQKERDTGSISVGNYVVNKHTADVRVWQVSHDVFHGDDGVLVTTNELERLQEELRKKHGIDSTSIQEYRFAHLAKRIIPREAAQSAVRLPITERSKDAAEVSCWKTSDHLISRRGRCPIISSSAGYRAFAEAEAIAFRPKYRETYSGPLCENRIKLFLAKAGESSFQVILESGQSENECVTVGGTDSCGVKGIQPVDWSRDGRFLVANLLLWQYESDSSVTRVPIIYDAGKSEVLRPDVYRFFEGYCPNQAKESCDFELVAQGFSPEGTLVFSASMPPIDPSSGQASCLDKKRPFLFELGANKTTCLPSDYKVRHYGTWSSGSVPKP
jgi:hypothetical protein